MFGSITMAYDIYKLSTEVEAIATKRAGDDIREIANQLEAALNSFLSGCNSISNSVCNLNLKNEEISSTDENKEATEQINESPEDIGRPSKLL